MRNIALLLVLATVVGAQETDAKSRQPAYLGVSLGDVGDEMRQRFKIDAAVADGALLLAVTEGSAAARAGWRAGDVIVRFDGQPIRNLAELVAVVRKRHAGDRVAYELRRRRGLIAGKITCGARPEPGERPSDVVPAPVVKAPVREAPGAGTLEQRLERIQKEIEVLRRRVQAEARTDDKKPEPRSLGGWIEKEQKAARAALARGDEQRARWHTIRLSVLREMRTAGSRMPRGRLDRMDKKLDAILQFLRHNK